MRASVPAAGRVSGPGPSLSSRDMTKIGLYSLLLLLAMTVSTGRMSVVLAALALVLSLGKSARARMGERLCLPVLGFAAFALVTGLAAIYGNFGRYAIGEYYKFLAAFGVAWVLLTQFEKKHVRGLLWGFGAVSGALALLSVDACGPGPLFQAFRALAGLLGATFQNVTFFSGNRVNGLYNDANVTAAIFALGALVCLYLALSEQGRRGRASACLLLGLSAQGFFLSLSRGAIVCFALTLAVWVAVAPRGSRVRLFLLMCAAALGTVALSFPAMAALGAGTPAVPALLTLLTGPVIFLLDLGAEPLARRLEGRGKLAALLAAALAAAALVYALAAVNLTGPYDLEAGETVSRSVKAPAGTYTLSGDWDGAPQVTVTTQTRFQRIQNTGASDTVYAGPLEGASFTLPEDDLHVVLHLSYPEGGGTVRALALSDGTEVPLGYPLLPAFVADRLQDDLFTSSSFTLRVQFMADALTLFGQSPLIGHGLSSTQGLYTAVQPFHYESLYVHSHLLQIMSDMGLLGLIPFLALMGGTLWLLIRARRRDGDPMAAMLIAVWTMMNAHSLMEINFSLRGFQCAAYALLMIAVLAYGEPLTARAAKKTARTAAWALSGAFWAYTLVFGGLVVSHRMVEREAANLTSGDASVIMPALRSLAARDVYEGYIYEVNFVRFAAQLDSPLYNGTAERYVEGLREMGVYVVNRSLAQDWYLPRGELEELFACSREGVAQLASDREAWDEQMDFYRQQVLMGTGTDQVERFLDGVLALEDYRRTFNEGRMEEIVFSQENQDFVALAAQVRDSGLTGGEAYSALLTGGAPSEP